MKRLKIEMKIFKNDKFKLTDKQIMAIELLINCKMTQKEIAEKVGKSEKTLYLWIHHNDVFRQAMEWYRKEVYKDLAPTAVETVYNIMINGDSDKVRLAAAQDILSRAGDDAPSEVDLKGEKDLLNVNIKVI